MVEPRLRPIDTKELDVERLEGPVGSRPARQGGLMVFSPTGCLFMHVMLKMTAAAGAGIRISTALNNAIDEPPKTTGYTKKEGFSPR